MAALAAPTSASAALVEGQEKFETRPEGGSIEISDPEGDRNDFRITAREGRILIRERGPARLRVRGNCRKEARRVVSCPAMDSNELTVDLARRSDALSVETENVGSSESDLSGGAGNDLIASNGSGAILRGDAGRDTLVGGDGADRLYGGLGTDRLRGGAGPDLLAGDGVSPTASGRDFLDGGAGRDLASWEERKKGVRVDLGSGLGGRGDEDDDLRAVEGALGGRGEDRLIGDSGPNVLRGGPGADTMRGRSGNDLIDGGSSGNAALGEADNSRDAIGCGEGVDRVEGSSADPGEPLGALTQSPRTASGISSTANTSLCPACGSGLGQSGWWWAAAKPGAAAAK